MSRTELLTDYYQSFEFQAVLRGRSVRVVSKPGLNEGEELAPATVLLASSVEVQPDAKLLVLGADRGALAAAFGPELSGGGMTIMDASFLSLLLAERTLVANDLSNAHVSWETELPIEKQDSYDVAVMVLPKGRDLARRWLLQAYLALKPGGQLYLAGANNEGIQPVIKDAQALFGNGETVENRQRNRVGRMTKRLPSPALPPWANEPGILPGSWHEFDLAAEGESFHLHTLPGIFSYDRLDDCTALLLPHLNAVGGTRVLDVGCGYGIIGMMAARNGAAKVDLIDASLLAIAAARKNLAENRIPHAEALLGDSLSAVSGRHYDLVVTNPPFHTGKAVNYDVAHSFIEEAASVLAPGGRMLLAANAFIRYERVIQRVFKSYRLLEENKKFYVLEAVL